MCREGKVRGTDYVLIQTDVEQRPMGIEGVTEGRVSGKRKKKKEVKIVKQSINAKNARRR